MMASAITMILMFKRNPRATAGKTPFRWAQSKNRCRITGVPGAVSTTRTTTPITTRVLAVEISTPRRSPSMRERLEPERSGPAGPAGMAATTSGFEPPTLTGRLLEHGDVGRGPREVLVRQVLQRAVALHGRQRLVHARHQGVALLECHRVGLVGQELPDHLGVLELVG